MNVSALPPLLVGFSTPMVGDVEKAGTSRRERDPLMTRDRSEPSQSCLVEITGAAGAGKSSLTRLICQGDPDCSLADFIHTRTPVHLVYVALSIPRLLPILAADLAITPRLTWAEFKLLVYVTQWRRFLRRRTDHHHGVTLLDQGPIYALVRLRAEGGGVTSSRAFERWWYHMIELWAGELSAIIWLDASDGILWDRINERAQSHRKKGENVDVGYQFIARYRQLFEEVFRRIEIHGGPEILRFDTGETTSERMAAEIQPILAAHSQTSVETQRRTGNSR